MKQTKLLMGMPISVEIIDKSADKQIFKKVYDYFVYVDNTYSTYKETSEISRINNGLPKSQWSQEMKDVLELCEQTKIKTNGYFDIERGGKLDPSGLVKGWAIQRASELINEAGFSNYYIDAGGDIQVSGKRLKGEGWHIGIRNPFNRDEVIKTVTLSNNGIATSGTAIRGQHIYNPHQPSGTIEDVVSLSVIGPDVYNADRFATAAFAMGYAGVEFIETLPSFEAYMINAEGIATMTSGFERYVV